MPSKKIARRLQDILANIERVRAYLSDFDRERYAADTRTRDAVERCLERICEAARKIGPGLDARYPEAQFQQLRQLGSVLRHDYDGIDADIVWCGIESHLGPLEAACREELSRQA